MNIRVVSVPYDSGRRSFRMGRGPEHLVRNGLLDRLETAGHAIDFREIVIDEPRVPSDIGSAMALNRLLANAVAPHTVALVLAGNCITSQGALAGLGSKDLGVVWFDSHGDLNTPDSTTSGFLDGMALSVIAGRCWKAVSQTVNGWVPVEESRIVLVGARDLDPPEEAYLRASAITHVPTDAILTQGVRAGLSSVLDALAERVSAFYVHLDLDVIDPGSARVNEYQASGGLNVDTLLECLELIAARQPVSGAALTAYDPNCDDDGRALRAAFRAVEVLVNGSRG